MNAELDCRHAVDASDFDIHMLALTVPIKHRHFDSASVRVGEGALILVIPVRVVTHAPEVAVYD